MALAFATPRVNIPSGTGYRTFEGVHDFGRTVNSANVATNGFKFDFANDDHNINVIEANPTFLRIVGNVVHYRAICQFADRNFDDAYSGFIDVLVIADVV